MVNPDKLFGRLGNRLFQMAYIYAQAKDGAISDIYVQDPKYAEKYGKELRKMLSDGIGFMNKIAIHVRRGDYVDNPFYVDLMQTDYYKKAMAEFPKNSFMVFSDDIEFCKKQDIFKSCEFSERWSEVGDLNEMASCVGHIIANSSFSWWGAWLSPHKGKVIAPKNWYSDGIERTKCPDSWILI